MKKVNIYVLNCNQWVVLLLLSICLLCIASYLTTTFLKFLFNSYSLNINKPFSPLVCAENDYGFPSRAQEPEHSHMAGKSGESYNTRYFIIKSLNHQNIQLAIDKGIWATQVMNEPILEEAFHVKPLLFISYVVFLVRCVI